MALRRWVLRRAATGELIVSTGRVGNFGLLEHTDVGSDVYFLLLGQPRGHKR